MATDSTPSGAGLPAAPAGWPPPNIIRPPWWRRRLNISRNSGLIAKVRGLTRLARSRARSAWSTTVATLPTLGVVIAAAALLGIVVIAGTIGYRLWRIPDWYLRGITASPDVARAVNEYRSSMTPVLTALVQTLGGAFLAGGLFFTWRQLRLAQSAQLTDRLTRAADQLAQASMPIRVNALLALERLGRDSPIDTEAILGIVLSFIEERCQLGNRLPRPHLPADVETALDVLGRWPTTFAGLTHRALRSLDLTACDLQSRVFPVRLVDCRFDRAKLRGATFYDLWDSSFIECDLSFSKIYGACETVRFDAATLHHARLVRTILRSTTFDGADLFRADLTSADMSRTSFFKAKLQWTDFSAVRLGPSIDFRSADLSLTSGLMPWMVQGTKTDEGTVMPQPPPQGS